MKKIILVMGLMLAMVLSMSACGSSAPKNHVGDTVATDRAELTLERAELGIALYSAAPANYVDFTYDYFMPKEYDAEKDSNNPYVAATGHSFVTFTFTVNNIDRGESLDLGGTFNPTFVKVKCGENEYVNDVAFGAEFNTSYGWQKHDSGNILILKGTTESYRAFMEIDEEPEDLNSPFDIIFCLPDSSGEVTEFTFAVNEGETAAIEKTASTAMLEGMNEAYGELAFVYKYADRFTNGFSTDVTDTLKESFKDVDKDAVVAEMVAAGVDEETAEKEINKVISETDKIRRLLVEMNKTHSGKNVSKIISKSIENMGNMSKLAYGDMSYAVIY